MCYSLGGYVARQSTTVEVGGETKKNGRRSTALFLVIAAAWGGRPMKNGGLHDTTAVYVQQSVDNALVQQPRPFPNYIFGVSTSILLDVLFSSSVKQR